MRARHVVLASLIAMVLAAPARAGHHNWDFTEIFSNASGTIQYVELDCPSNGEAGLGPFTVTTGTNTLNFTTNLPSTTTANTWVLCATSNFAALPGGIAPDYIIPANFFSTAGGTMNYAGGADLWPYGAVPTNGVDALQRNNTTAANTPRNFAGASGGVNVGLGVPATSTWGIVLLLGALLLVASGLLRKQERTTIA